MISESEQNLDFIVSVFKIKLMCYLGFMPIIDKCSNCNTKENLMYFSFKDSRIKM